MAKPPAGVTRCPKSCPSHGRERCQRHTWRFLVELPPGQDGRRIQVKRSGFETAAAAGAARADTLTSYRAGTLPTSTASRTTTTAEYLAGWLDAKRDVRPSTLAAYRTHLDRHVAPTAFGRTPLARLDAAATRTFLASLDDKGLSPATQRRVLATIRSAMSDAIPQVLAADPTRLPKREEARLGRAAKAPKVDPWTVAQVDQFVATLTDPVMAALVTLASRTGLRAGEIAGLRWEDVDKEFLTVRRQAVRLAGATAYASPKSAAGQRRVPLVPAATRALRAARKAQAAQRLAAGAGWTTSGYVFTDRWGEGLLPSNISKRFGEHVRRSDLPPTRLHDLRHAAATHLLRGGVPLSLVSRVLGHSSTAITDAVYSHVRSEDAADAMAKAFR